MPRLDRLSALDAAFLDLETVRAPLHVGWTMRLAGPAPSLAALRRHVAGRLDAVPRLRRRVVEPALGLADPHWADDAGFDVARHVHAVDLPAPAGTAELEAAAGLLLGTPLDPARPLWRLTLVRGLPDGFAVVGQAHHALVDGVAAVELAGLLLDPAGVARLPRRPAPGWEPAPAPAAGPALARAGTRRARSAAGLIRADPADVPGLVAAAGRLAAPAPPTALEAMTGPERRAAFAATALEPLRDAAREHGATVNDALLTAAAFALRGALARRGDVPPAVRALVPASTRGAGDAAGGNRISFLAVDLPLGGGEPARVLRTVRDRTRARKRAGDAGAADVLLRAADALPAPGRRATARAAARRARFTLVVSNVPGPDLPLALLGREVTGAWPAVPLLDGQALSIGALSYAGRLHVGVVGDAQAVPDTDRIARDLEAALGALSVPAAPARTPWRERAEARRALRRSA
ncbi:MAG: wax ester/triacylglycerol synthase family O-acyltransferase [Solirubrobacteraceae bacterium]|nr:wax ester/triacylglycerol synthase family O-acyltransferase [Solirubrobacteraceae bacterium]